MPCERIHAAHGIHSRRRFVRAECFVKAARTIERHQLS